MKSVPFAQCEKCSLLNRPIVKGQVGKNKKIVFIGEAPGWWEVQKGIPFVGQAGMLLGDLLLELGLNKSDMCISNSCLCHPVNESGNNRTPTKEEIICCNERLLKSIEILRPRIVVALGAIAYYSLVVDSSLPLSVVRMSEVVGKRFKSKNGYSVLVTYHPAFILRNSSYKNKLTEHIKMAIDLSNS